MNLFGFTITRATTKQLSGQFQSVYARQSAWWRIWESFPGAWQQNLTETPENALKFYAVYACVTLIATDMAKMRLRLVEQDEDGLWSETDSPAFSPVLRQPNHYQNRYQFVQWWVTTKLIHGNSYALKQRDARGVVSRLYILDPCRVKPLVAPDGSVFYELKDDTLSGLEEGSVIVPAREIIHEAHAPKFHPLVGLSPLYACAQAAIQGLQIQTNSSNFFTSGSQPGGVITAPGTIAQPTADRMKVYWDTNFSGANAGKVAVLGDGLTYTPLTMISPKDAELIAQLNWSAEAVCSAFGVPLHKINVGPPPNYNNIEAYDRQYYSNCIQGHIESMEAVFDYGLELPRAPRVLGVEFNRDDLIGMESSSQINLAVQGVNGAIFTPNEARRRFDLKPKKGGDSLYMQEQDHSLAALSQRDEMFGVTVDPLPALPAPAEDDDEVDDDEAARQIMDMIRKELAA